MCWLWSRWRFKLTFGKIFIEQLKCLLFYQNVTTSEYSEEVNNLIEPFIYEWVASKRGSISAEHGIGFKKTNYLHFSKSNEAIDQMKLLKNLFDPNNILNPYKVLPQ